MARKRQPTSPGREKESTAPNVEGKGSKPQGEHPEFPIVAIGASAGGLDALEQFLTNMPADTGMAFVLVQHLDPTHKSILVDLVNRYTPMKVFEVQDGMRVEPNCAYIIPPNRDMAILHGTLQLIEPTAPRGLRLPIDHFFRSFAQDQEERAICIVLSGTGTDGTLGLKAIKEQGGMAMVQEPESAKYDGMPRSAIATGLVDFVLPAEKMMDQLIAFLHHAFVPGAKEAAAPLPKSTDDLQKIYILLRNQSGHDFSSYKPNTIVRRIERRMTVNQIERVGDYVRYLQHNPSEVETLFKELLIGVSNFFRDPEAFEILEKQVIPAVFKSKQTGQPIRIWVPSCATGEEAYSIAILLREQMETLKRDFQIQVFATDIDSKAIETARSGIYPASIAVDVSPERLNRFFMQEDNTYHVNKVVRDMVVFAEQNIIKDSPFSRLDLISCRNLLIYLGADLQERVLQLCHYALNQDGYLFLGNSETIGEHTDLFEVVDRKWKVFRRTGKTSQAGKDYHPPTLPFFTGVRGIPAQLAEKPQKTNLRRLTERLLLEDYAPACVTINDKGEVLYIHGRTGKYLEPAPGDARMNILEMAREGLRLDLTNAIRKAMVQRKAIRRKGLTVKTNGENQVIDLTVKPLQNQPGSMLVLFEDMASQEPVEPAERLEPSDPANQRVRALEHEIRSTKEYLQTTIEELETSNEELKSTNEELQSSNEELQSTNEELETSKEELQSVNEELVTVNSEHEVKLEELAKANNDMVNLLAGTNIGTIFLDLHLCIKRFTPTAAQLINLIPTDIGRPLRHIVSNLVYDHLTADVKEVLETLVPKEKEVQTREGRWYLMHIRPYRTTENAIEGAVITFVDISELKQLSRLATIVRDSNDAITLQDLDGKILAWNQGAEKMYGYSEKEALKMSIQDLVPSDKRQQAIAFAKSLAEGERVESFETQRLTKDGRALDVWLTVTLLTNETRELVAIATTERDITERRRVEEALRRSSDQLSLIIDTLPQLIAYVDADQRYRFNNKAYEECLGLARTEIKGRHVEEVLGKETYQAMRGHIETALSGKEVSFNSTITPMEGSARKVRVQYLPHRSNTDMVKGFFAVIDDITD